MARIRWAHVVSSALFVSSIAGRALADDEGGWSAREAYDKGAAALERGDYGEAARLFAKADQLAPNPVALQAALRAATSADSPAVAMELVDRAEERAPGAALGAAVAAARAAFSERVGRLKILCSGCTAKLDGEGTPLDKQRYVSAGYHIVEFDFEERMERQTVRVLPGKNVRASPKNDGTHLSASETPPSLEVPPEDAPSNKEKAKPAAPSGLSPAWFVTACGLTATAAAVTIASGVDTLKKHSEFNRVPTQDNANAGRAADFRTQILGGVTAATVVGTVVLGAFFVRWKDVAPVAPSAFLVPRAGGASLSGSFLRRTATRTAAVALSPPSRT